VGRRGGVSAGVETESVVVMLSDVWSFVGCIGGTAKVAVGAPEIQHSRLDMMLHCSSTFKYFSRAKLIHVHEPNLINAGQVPAQHAQ
jgi:hypothetical protein